MDGTIEGGGADYGRRTGAMLAAARAARGIELADIARDTRVPLRHLKALEIDDHSGLPALPYAIGFVKSYARAVGLDAEALALQFRAETSKQPHSPVAPSFEPLDGRRLPSSGLVTVSILVIVLLIAGLSAWGAGMFDPAPPAVVAEAPATIADPAADAGPGADPAALSGPADAMAATPDAALAGTPAPADPAAVAAPVAMGGDTVVLTAREEVWVRIADRAAGVTARIGVMAPGESFTVPAGQPGLRLTTGKAGALAITVGGRAIPPLGGPVDVLRNISLVPADLIARGSGMTPAVAASAPAVAAPSGPRPLARVPRRTPPPVAAPPASPPPAAEVPPAAGPTASPSVPGTP